MGKSVCIILICLSFLDQAIGQSHTFQIWSDFTVAVPLKNTFHLENQLAWRGDVNGSPKWQELRAQSLATKRLGDRWDLLAYLLVDYTDQTKNLNTSEIRPGVGARFYILKQPSLSVASVFRYEARQIYSYDVATWTHDDRFRLRVETNVAIKRGDIPGKYAIYALTDAEFFYTVDTEVRERYANRLRLRRGIGYTLSKFWQVEAVYAYQVSRNTLVKPSLDTRQNVIWVRVVYSAN